VREEFGDVEGVQPAESVVSAQPLELLRDAGRVIRNKPITGPRVLHDLAHPAAIRD
jgi:hypothetical protein